MPYSHPYKPNPGRSGGQGPPYAANGRDARTDNRGF